MKERIQKIVQNQKVELVICVMAIFLSVMCFVSSNAGKPAKTGQDSPAQLAGDTDAVHLAEKGNEAQPGEKGDEAQPEKTDGTAQPEETDGTQLAHSEQDAQLDEVFSHEADSSVDTAGAGRKNRKAVFDLDEAVGQAVLDCYESEYADMECQTEGHKILGHEKQDGHVMVYALTTYGGYCFADECLVKGAGIGVIPAVMKFSYDKKNGYVLKDYQKTEDEYDMQQWVMSMFPGPLWETCSSFGEEVSADLAKQERAYAEQYLQELGRKAPIGNEQSDREVLTDVGVSVEVSNKLCEMDEQLEKYPYWIGSQEELEGGIRYIYELALAKEAEEIVYTKTEYDTDKVVEQFRFDMHTGEEIKG